MKIKSKSQQLKSIKVAAHWSIWGWLLIIPGLIASIVAVVKISLFHHHQQNSSLKIVSIVFLLIFFIVGGITSLVFVNNEKELLYLENNQDNADLNLQPQQQFQSSANSNNDYL